MNLFKAIVVFIIIVLPAVSQAANYQSKELGYIRGPDSRPCILFQLKGVTDAGGTASPWFALPFSHHGYKDMYSMMLSAKMAGKTIDVNTSGIICGHAAVTVMGMP